MKNIFLSLFILMIFGCKAQTPIVPRYNSTGYGDIDGAYYKDINNFQNQFIGSWLLDNGTTYLKISFIQKPMFHKTTVKNSYYVDYLVGEYEYRENGVTKVNTLPNLLNNHSDIYDYNLVSSTELDRKSAPISCSECLANEQRLLFNFSEPTRLHPWAPSADFIARVITENGVQKLKIQFYGAGSDMGAPTPELKNFSIPYGDYTLLKQ